jgi:glycosyltransferase involved in cell wall biosynthesis
MLITVVTPTYNRSLELKQLYHSLCKQTYSDFEWLVIDDGSADDTKNVVEQFVSANKIKIRYLYKENGGKHTALNVAFRVVSTELLFIVDSDDILTEDAVQCICNDWEQVKNKNLCGISYLRGYSSDKVIGDLYPYADKSIDNFINLRFNNGINGDKAEVWVTKYLRDYRYPEYEGEKFISESVAWIHVSRNYDMLFVNKIIYITEYLEGGLSDSGRALRFRCPNNMAYGSLETMSKEFSMKIRIKETLLYIVYSRFGGKSIRQMIDCKYPVMATLCLLPGLLLYKYWKYKYKM